jgi:hypothetical protein
MNLKTTNTMSYTKVQSEEIVWCPNDDRHILIKKVNDAITGLNYCQGDDIEHFADLYIGIDHDLTKFYRAIHPYLHGVSELDRINQAIWAHHSYRND